MWIFPICANFSFSAGCVYGDLALCQMIIFQEENDKAKEEEECLSIVIIEDEINKDSIFKI